LPRLSVVAEVVGRCRRSRSLPDWIAFVTVDWSALVAAAVGRCQRNGSREQFTFSGGRSSWSRIVGQLGWSLNSANAFGSGWSLLCLREKKGLGGREESVGMKRCGRKKARKIPACREYRAKGASSCDLQGEEHLESETTGRTRSSCVALQTVWWHSGGRLGHGSARLHLLGACCFNEGKSVACVGLSFGVVGLGASRFNEGDWCGIGMNQAR
jgi:hypothetical protein